MVSAEMYLDPFAAGFLVSIGVSLLILWLLNHGAGRIVGHSQALRFGGIAIVVGFIIALLINRRLVFSMPLGGSLAGLAIITIFGLWDDLKRLSWKPQLIFQLAIASMVFWMGVRIVHITNPLGGLIVLQEGLFFWLSYVLVVFWLVVLMNAINWLDGVDGLSGGVVFIVALTIALVSLKPEVNQPPMAIMALAFAGGILGFLVWNHYPAKLMAGTVGSWSMGFVLGVLSVFSGAKVATALLVLTIPLVDFLWVIIERLRHRNSIFQADRRHLHYKLMELGWSPNKICLVFYAITFGLAVVSLNTRAGGKIVTGIIFVCLTLMALLLIEKRLEQKKIASRL